MKYIILIILIIAFIAGTQAFRVNTHLDLENQMGNGLLNGSQVSLKGCDQQCGGKWDRCSRDYHYAYNNCRTCSNKCADKWEFETKGYTPRQESTSSSRT